MIGEKIANLRKSKNLTQEQLSELLGVSRQSVSKWESDLAFPETNHLILLSEILECSIDYLLKDENQNMTTETKEEHPINKVFSFIKKNWRKIYIGLYLGSIAATIIGLFILNASNNFIIEVDDRFDYADLSSSINVMNTTKEIMSGVGVFSISLGAVLFIIATILLVRDIIVNKKK